MEQIREYVYSHSIRMKKSQLTPKQVSSVPCPTCGLAIRKSCVLNSGAPRSTPHVDQSLPPLKPPRGNRAACPYRTCADGPNFIEYLIPALYLPAVFCVLHGF